MIVYHHCYNLIQYYVRIYFSTNVLQIPGRWEIFLNELRISAVEDCIKFYESDMKILHRRADLGVLVVEILLYRTIIYELFSVTGPINETELKVRSLKFREHNLHSCCINT